MDESKPIPLEHHLQLLEAIEDNPQLTQADLAAQLGIAVGTINWYLKRLINRGLVKIQRMQRKRLLYLITPIGIAEKSRLGVRYMQDSLRVYRRTREQVNQSLIQARGAGYRQIFIEDNGDLGEICRLTCMEQGIPIAENQTGSVPALRIDGTKVKLVLPKRTSASNG